MHASAFAPTLFHPLHSLALFTVVLSRVRDVATRHSTILHLANISLHSVFRDAMLFSILELPWITQTGFDATLESHNTAYRTHNIVAKRTNLSSSAMPGRPAAVELQPLCKASQACAAHADRRLSS